MIVADAGTPQFRVARAGSHPHVPGAGGNSHQAFEDAGDIGTRQAEIAVAALLFGIDDAGILELAEVPARSREHDASLLGELGRGERPAVHERGQHIGTRRVSQQRRDGGDVRSIFHSLTLAEVSSRRKLLRYRNEIDRSPVTCGSVSELTPGERQSDWRQCPVPIVEAPMQPAAATSETIGNVREYALLVVLAILWGASYAFIRLGVATIPPVTLIAARTLIGGALLFAMLAARGYAMPLEAAMWRRFMFQALLNSVVPFTLIAWAEQTVEAGLTTILCSTSPIFTFLITFAITRHEPVTFTKLLGVVAGIGGICLIVGLEALSGIGKALIADLALIAATLCFAGAAIFGRGFGALDPLVPATGSMLCGSMVLVPISLMAEAPWTIAPSATSVMALIALSVFSTAFAFALYFRLLRTLGSVGVTAQAYLRVPVGVAIGAAFLGESLPPSALIGLAGVIAGVAAMVVPARG